MSTSGEFSDKNQLKIYIALGDSNLEGVFVS